jgi:Zn finger protein HypA/HybF involved in hydrogenase expression
MPDPSVVASVMTRIQSLAHGHHVLSVRVQVGAEAPLSPVEFCEAFARACRGTEAEGARLEVEALNDLHDRRARDVVVTDVEVRE